MRVGEDKFVFLIAQTLSEQTPFFLHGNNSGFKFSYYHRFECIKFDNATQKKLLALENDRPMQVKQRSIAFLSFIIVGSVANLGACA